MLIEFKQKYNQTVRNNWNLDESTKSIVSVLDSKTKHYIGIIALSEYKKKKDQYVVMTYNDKNVVYKRTLNEAKKYCIEHFRTY